MKTLFVNEITETPNAVHGLVSSPKFIVDNFKTVFGEDYARKLLLFTTIHDSFYIVERFYQFVGFIQFEKGLGFSMKLSDFKGNIDNVLDEYLALQAVGWPKDTITKYVKIVNQIASDNKKQLAHLMIDSI